MGERPARTLFDKIWSRHQILEAQERVLLHVDLNYIHEGSRQAFAALEAEGRTVRCPEQTVAIADHYVPTSGRPTIADPAVGAMVAALEANTRRHGIAHIGLDSADQGIVHVVGPELGLTLPGMFVTCADSHVATHGALGALTWAIGASDLKHVLATQTLRLRRPQTMQVQVNGRLADGVGAKDIALYLITTIGANGAAGHVIEFAGPAIRSLGMAGRFTLCNLSVEAGARSSLIAPDETTLDYLVNRRYAPTGGAWNAALRSWRQLCSDDGAPFDRAISLESAEIAPMVTWGTSPEDAVPIDGRVPDPARIADPDRRAQKERALRYMGLTPGTRLADVAVDRVFIGSCANARLEDLRDAASIVKGRKAVVPGFVVPGSQAVKRLAEAEGLDTIFRAAGLEWREPGCSMCAGVNGDLLRPGERCAATSNRNFEGRQGRDARTHLMSPAMAAAAAVTGRLSDVRRLKER